MSQKSSQITYSNIQSAYVPEHLFHFPFPEIALRTGLTGTPKPRSSEEIKTILRDSPVRNILDVWTGDGNLPYLAGKHITGEAYGLTSSEMVPLVKDRLKRRALQNEPGTYDVDARVNILPGNPLELPENTFDVVIYDQVVPQVLKAVPQCNDGQPYRLALQLMDDVLAANGRLVSQTIGEGTLPLTIAILEDVARKTGFVAPEPLTGYNTSATLFEIQSNLPQYAIERFHVPVKLDFTTEGYVSFVEAYLSAFRANEPRTLTKEEKSLLAKEVREIVLGSGDESITDTVALDISVALKPSSSS